MPHLKYNQKQNIPQTRQRSSSYLWANKGQAVFFCISVSGGIKMQLRFTKLHLVFIVIKKIIISLFHSTCEYVLWYPRLRYTLFGRHRICFVKCFIQQRWVKKGLHLLFLLFAKFYNLRKVFFLFATHFHTPYEFKTACNVTQSCQTTVIV